MASKIPGTKSVAAKTPRPSAKELRDTFSDEDVLFAGDPIPAGQYELRATEPKIAYFEERPMVNVRLVVTAGPLEGRGFNHTLWLDHEKEDGTPSRSLDRTYGTLAVMTGGVPAAVQAVGKSRKQLLAEAIVETIDGAEFKGTVGQRASKTNPDQYFNTLIPVRPEGWKVAK